MTTNNKIDLNTCVPGQKVKLRSGEIANYRKHKPDSSYHYQHWVGDRSYTDDGKYVLGVSHPIYDVVEILPLEKESKPVTDLRTCVPGQKLRRRDGRISIYKKATDSAEYPHQTYNGGTYTDEGYYWLDKCHSNSDVMEILPMENKPEIDLNTCVQGQKVRLRSGRINYYTGPIKDGYGGEYTHQINGDSYMNNGCYWSDERKSELDVVEILPMEEEPAKTSTELTHSITDQIDVTSPDHVSIIPQSNGVLISIKKGLTTISWRHYNH